MNAPGPTPEQLQEDMEYARIAFERWRNIRARPMLRDENPDKYEQLRRDEIRAQNEEEE